MGEKKSFWATLPGILTGLAGIITAAGGLLVILYQIGVLGPKQNINSIDREERLNADERIDEPRPDQNKVELTIDSFSIDPMPPIQRQPVHVTTSIRNSGNVDAKDVLIKWWPGVNFPDPLTKTVSLIKAGEVVRVSFNYSGYRSWYGRIETKIWINPNNSIPERHFDNNIRNKYISVLKAKELQPEDTKKIEIIFSELNKDIILNGNEFVEKGIKKIKAAPEGEYCKNAQAAIRYRTDRYNYSFLTTAMRGDFKRCNTVPLKIYFVNPVRVVNIHFAGADRPYKLEAYRNDGSMIGFETARAKPYDYKNDYKIRVFSEKPDISWIRFGHTSALTMIKKIEILK